MNKKIFAILMATLMSATVLAAVVTVADEETPPSDTKIPETLPEEPLLAIKDMHPESDDPLPDLIITNMGRQYHSNNGTYEIWYRLYNNGDANIVNANFTDKAWIYVSGHWNGIAASEIAHTNFNLQEDHYSNYFSYYFYAVSGWHTLSQWTDTKNTITESDEGNNYSNHLWLWA